MDLGGTRRRERDRSAVGARSAREERGLRVPIRTVRGSALETAVEYGLWVAAMTSPAEERLSGLIRELRGSSSRTDGDGRRTQCICPGHAGDLSRATHISGSEMGRDTPRSTDPDRRGRDAPTDDVRGFLVTL